MQRRRRLSRRHPGCSSRVSTAPSPISPPTTLNGPTILSRRTATCSSPTRATIPRPKGSSSAAPWCTSAMARPHPPTTSLLQWYRVRARRQVGCRRAQGSSACISTARYDWVIETLGAAEDAALDADGRRRASTVEHGASESSEPTDRSPTSGRSTAGGGNHQPLLRRPDLARCSWLTRSGGVTPSRNLPPPASAPTWPSPA